MKNPRYPYIIRLAAIMITLVLIVMSMYYLKVVLVPLLFSIIFAVMLFPLCIRLEKWGASRGLAAFTAVFLTTAFLSFIFYILFTQVINFASQIPQITDHLTKMIDDLRDFMAKRFSMNKAVVGNKIQEQLSTLQNTGGDMLVNSVTKISALLINIFLIPLYIFFLLYYRHFFIEFFYKVFYSSEKTLIDETLEKINHVVKGYLLGQFLDILIIGIANSIALYAIGIGYPVVLGFSISIFCIIPYLGMILGSLVALLTAFLTTHTGWQPATAFIVLWIIHIIDSNFVAPMVIGSKVSINPLMGIFMLFLFGELWGLPGLFLAFPITAILKVVFDTVPDLHPYGFVLGEPEKYHLKRHSMMHIKSLQRLLERRKKKPVNDLLPGEVTPGENEK